jgi:hypothetical protein
MSQSFNKVGIVGAPCRASHDAAEAAIHENRHPHKETPKLSLRGLYTYPPTGVTDFYTVLETGLNLKGPYIRSGTSRPIRPSTVRSWVSVVRASVRRAALIASSFSGRIGHWV